MSRFRFADINLENILVLIALSVSLIMAIWMGQDNLAMSIATGLLGYIGGTVASTKINTNVPKTEGVAKK